MATYAMVRCAFLGVPGAVETNQGARVRYDAWVCNTTAPYCGFLQNVCTHSMEPCWMARLLLLAEFVPPKPMQGLLSAGREGVQDIAAGVAAAVRSGKALRWK